MDELFESNIFYSPDGCWYWTGAAGGWGYGRFQDKSTGKYVGAHRYSYEAHTGEKIPPGKLIMHICDNPPCVNPHHLRVGTHADNARDCANKGRSCHGSRSGQSKLTTVQVLALREAYAAGYSKADIANYFRMTSFAIRAILKNKSWFRPEYQIQTDGRPPVKTIYTKTVTCPDCGGIFKALGMGRHREKCQKIKQHGRNN